jgi:hypothetical protein
MSRVGKLRTAVAEAQGQFGNICHWKLLLEVIGEDTSG